MTEFSPIPSNQTPKDWAEETSSTKGTQSARQEPDQEPRTSTFELEDKLNRLWAATSKDFDSESTDSSGPIYQHHPHPHYQSAEIGNPFGTDFDRDQDQDPALLMTSDLNLNKHHHQNHQSQRTMGPEYLGPASGTASGVATPASLSSPASSYHLFDKMSMVSPALTPAPRDLEPEQVPIHTHSKSATRELSELPTVVCESRARIPTTTGTEIFLHLYRNDFDDKEHLAIVFGQNIRSKSLFAVRPEETEQDRMTRGAYEGRLYPGRVSSKDDDSSSSDNAAAESAHTHKDTLVRIHSECYTGETAWSARCDCGEQLDEAARQMAKEGSGIIVYLRQEGRGIGLGEKLKAYNLQDLGADTVTANIMLRHPADARYFGLATAILRDLGQSNIRLLTNNPDKITAVEGKHKEITVTERVPMIPLSWQNKGGIKSKEVELYLQTKVERMGHLLDLRN